MIELPLPTERYGEDTGVLDRLKATVAALRTLSENILDWYKQQPTGKKILFAILGVLAATIVVLFGIFHIYVIKALIWVADEWKNLKFGWIILFFLVFFVGFPPLLGFSALSILSGMVYGIFGGWVLLSLSSVTGSFASFMFFRYVLRERSEKLLQSNEKFRAFADILRQDQSLLLLILIRLCPLPYSLSNGALAAIPELSPITYLLASIITAPKQFIHVFVGHQLKDIGDDKNTTTRRIIDLVSIIITGCASALTTYIIYSKMQRKLEQYHSLNHNQEEYDDLIFGNFNDNDSNNLELDSAEFDADNFIIGDDEEFTAEVPKPDSPVPSPKRKDLDKGLELTSDDLSLNGDSHRSYRDY